MQISARSYLTAGVSLTAAAAVALTPLVVPIPDRGASIPTVTVSDIQLTVTPGEVIAFFDNLRTQLDGFNAVVAEAAAIPGQTLADGIRAAMALNDQIFQTLIDSTSNPTLQLLLETLDISADRVLRSLASYVEDSNQTIVVAGKDIADILSGMLTVSLANVLASVVDVANNPTSFVKYAHVLAATVGSGALIVNESAEVVRKAVNAGLDVTYGTLELARVEITTALDTVRRLAFVGAGATGSPLVEAVVSAIGTIGLAPAYLGVRVPFSVAGETVLSSQAAFNTLINGIAGYRDAEGQMVPGIVTALGMALTEAIDEIGRGPLDPQRYLAATALMVIGSFDALNIKVNTIGSLAQVPFDLGINLISPDSERPNVTGALVAMNVQVANSIANLLATLGLSEDIANLPLVVAQQLNDAIYGTAYTVADGLANVNAIITGGTNLVIEVSNTIENAILGGLSGQAPGVEPPEPVGPVGEDDEVEDNEFIAVAAVTEDAEDGDAETTEAPVVDEDASDEDASDEDASDEDASDEDASDEDASDEDASDEDVSTDDDSTTEDATTDDESEGYDSRSEDKSTEKDRADRDGSSDSDGGSEAAA